MHVISGSFCTAVPHVSERPEFCAILRTGQYCKAAGWQQHTWLRNTPICIDFLHRCQPAQLMALNLG
jgi:hypothetical protein